MARPSFPPPSFPPLDDDFTRALLRSAEADEPSSAAYTKAVAALGVGAGLGVGASLAAPSMIAAGAAGAARWSSSTALRLWALGVSGALLVGGGALLLTVAGPGSAASRGGTSASRGIGLRAAPSARPTSVVAPAPVVVAPAPPVIARSQAELAPVELDADALAAQASAHSPASAGLAPTKIGAGSGSNHPSAAARPGSSSPGARASVAHRALRSASDSSASPGSSGSSGSSLAEQVQSLDRARVELGSGNAAGALSEIAQYRKAWPQGVFLTEASVLEIEALASRGERSLAAARAAAFVAAHPDSPQAERLRRLIPAQKP